MKHLKLIVWIILSLTALIGLCYSFEAYNANESEVQAGFQQRDRQYQIDRIYQHLIYLRQSQSQLTILLYDCQRRRGDCRALEQELVNVKRQIAEQERRLRALQR